MVLSRLPVCASRSMELAFLRPCRGQRSQLAPPRAPQDWNAHVSTHCLNKEGFPAPPPPSDTGSSTLC